MSFFEFPHTRTYDTDLGWIIKHLGELITETNTLEEWAASHKKEYKDLKDTVQGLIDNLIDVIVPWDSSAAYKIFSVVEYQETNYIALQDVPAGIMITNTDYWQPANTVVEQINAIGAATNDVRKNALMMRNYQVEPEYLNKVRKTEWLESISNFDSATYNLLQGGEYDSRRNRYVMAFSDTSYINAVLIAFNEDMTVISHSDPLPIGHANDIAYNPNDDCLYICAGETGLNANKVIKVSAETFTILDTYEFPEMTDAPWMIAFNEDLNRYYLVSDDEVMICDNLFNTLQRIVTDIRNIYSGNTRMLKQAMFYYDDIVYVVNMTGAGTINGYGNGVYLSMYDPADFDYIGTINIKEINPTHEIEFIAMRPDGIGLCMYGQYYLTDAYIRLNKSKILNQSNAVNISTAKILPEGTDLNTVILEGNYVVRTNEINSIVNKPSNETNTYKIVVDYAGYGQQIRQTAYYASGSIYDRLFSNGNWSNWGPRQALRKGNSFPLAGTCCAGYIFGGATSIQFSIPVNMLIDANANCAFSENTNIIIRSIDGIITTGGNNGQPISDFNPQITKHYINFDVFISGFENLTPNTPVVVSFPRGNLVYS